MDSRLPASLAAYTAELERRIGELERSPRLTRATVTGFLHVKDQLGDAIPRIIMEDGGIWVLNEAGETTTFIGGEHGAVFIQDNNGNAIATFGPVNPPRKGILFQSGGNTGLHWDSEEGLLQPYEHIPFRDLNDQRSITSGTHADMYHATAEFLQCVALKVTFWLHVDAGTTAEARITRQGGGSTSVTHVGDGTTRVMTCYWLHGGALNSGPHTFNLSVARTAGAGSVVVWTPQSLALGTYPQATTSGAWSGNL